LPAKNWRAFFNQPGISVILFIIFLLGLIVGSFLNAVIFRLHSGESFVMSRSHCPHCDHELSAMDLIPVISYLLLSGKCRYCQKKISWQYPTVELLTAVIFVLIASNFVLPLTSIQFWVQVIMAGFLIVIAVFDLKHYLILDKVIFPALIIITAYNFYDGFLVNGLLGALLISGFFAAQYFISSGRWIGFGDVKFGLVLGSIFGWKVGIVMLVLAYFIGAIVGVILLIRKTKELKSELPFGVFLSIAAILMMIYGQRISEWYFGLIGF
jgi:leader peptidase (prepilin peptidase)/N-methyltransferase